AHSPSRLGDGTEVLAPDKEHGLHRGQIVDEYAEGQALPPGYRVVELRSGKAFALPEARLIPWPGYPQRLLAGCQGSSKQTPNLRCAVWRCEIWTEGLFSLLFWALGWLEAEAAASSQATNLLIDWTDPRILLHGGGERYANNAWNHFFEQPAGEGISMQSLEAASDDGRLKIVVRFGMPWFKKFGEFRGADEGNGDVQGIRGGRVDDAAARAGRAAMRRWVRVRPNIRQRVEAWCDAQQEDVARSLAAHIRRTDKLEQCRSNQWSEKELAMQIRGFCSSLALPCVFLCSDDVSLKGQLARQLGRDGLRVLSFDALLSSGGLPSHKDEKLDRRQNAEDVLVEVLIMSRCAALLSTYSNVSVAAVYFSEPGFPFFMFGDGLPEGSRAAPVASYGGFRSSRACYCRVACRVRAWQSRRRRCGRQPAFESSTKKMQLPTSVLRCQRSSGAELQLPLPQDFVQGAIFFTSPHTGDLVRLDCKADGCSKPLAIAAGLETYSGLVPWSGHLVAATKTHKLVQVDPWCQDSSCPLKTLVDVEHALGELMGPHGNFSLGGITWCQDSLFVVFGAATHPGPSGVMRCANCSVGHDCTSSCSLVDGGKAAGKGSQELSGFAAGIACMGERVLVTDNSNFRVQAIPAGCAKAPCEIETFAQGLKWPLGIAVVNGGSRILVTLDEGIKSLHSDGSSPSNFSYRGDTGGLCEGDGKVLAVDGSTGNILSFDPVCDANCAASLIWNSTGSTE
ncbi:unnamed protein product, partial [Symbiodinium sp. CCMP2456]